MAVAHHPEGARWHPHPDLAAYRHRHGGYQTDEQIADAMVAGARLGDMAGDRLMRSDALLRHGGIDRARERLAGVRAPRVAIIGASTSAIACAVQLLKCHDLPFGAEAITLDRPDAAQALLPDGRGRPCRGIHRFHPGRHLPGQRLRAAPAGLRLESRELVLRMLALGGRTPDPRLALHRIAAMRPARARHYRRGRSGDRGARLSPARCRCSTPMGWPSHWRMRRGGRWSTAIAISSMRRIGRCLAPMASVCPPVSCPGGRWGEKSFRGRPTGLWLWQNDVGRMIVDHVLGQGDAQSGAAAA
jgi:hypothetical protein